MTNNKLFLLLGTSLSLLPSLTSAQCVATQDCTTLGYTESSCNGGKGVKCPFGNWWACLVDEQDICRKNGFTEECKGAGQIPGGDGCGGLYKQCSCNSSYQYTCTGTGYAGGSGASCNGKYAQCKCTSDYEWANGVCQGLTGAIGDVYKCNGKVVAVKAPSMNFYIALTNLGKLDWYEGGQQCRNYVFCNNLKGTFPSPNQLKTIYNNKSSLNSLLTTYGSTKLSGTHWSSEKRYYHGSGGYKYYFYYLDMTNGREYSPSGVNSTDPGRGSHKILPILTSW